MNAEIAAFPGPFPGTIKAPLDVPALTRSADLVCKGEVVYRYDEGEVRYRVENQVSTFKQLVAVFHVDRVYKGAIATSTIEIAFLQSDIPSSLERLDRGAYVLVFLQRHHARYQFVNMTTSKMPIGREPLPAAQGKTSPLARIRKALVRSLADPDPAVAMAAIEQLGRLSGKASIPALQPLIESTDANRRGAALAALLNLGDTTSLVAAVRFVEQTAQVPEIERTRIAIYDAIANLSDPTAASALIPLLRHSDAALRESAARALRTLRAQAAVPQLIAALDDADAEVRYQALMALAETTGRPEWGATIDEFDSDETKYISRWKARWEQEGQR